MFLAARFKKTSLLTLFAGSLGRQPLNEIFLSDHPEIAGPFQGANPVQQFQDACDIDIKEDVLIVFTHDDIVPPNIILTSGLNPRVAAAIDWGMVSCLLGVLQGATGDTASRKFQ